METGSKKLVILSYAIVCFHPSVSFNNEKICCAISEDKIAVCEKTAGLRSGNFSDLNSACQKVVVHVVIIADIFGKTTDNIFESGFSDADSKEDFYSKLSILKSKWARMHNRCEEFYDWFNDNKTDEFVNSVINPVRKLAGLGCPPEKFTTNRSKRTNGIIQDYLKRECSGNKVNEYVFALTMQKLIDVQEKEIEPAVVNRGEYNDGETEGYSLKEN